MWNYVNSFAKIRLLSLFLLLLLSLASPAHGSPMITGETSQSIIIPMTQWEMLTSESKALSSELTAYKAEFQKLKKPSAELLSQLDKAEKMLLQLQTELALQKNDLTALSKDRDALKTSLQTLKTQIDKERRVHRRQIWQNRIWSFLAGGLIAAVVSNS